MTTIRLDGTSAGYSAVIQSDGVGFQIAAGASHQPQKQIVTLTEHRLEFVVLRSDLGESESDLRELIRLGSDPANRIIAAGPARQVRRAVLCAVAQRMTDDILLTIFDHFARESRRAHDDGYDEARSDLKAWLDGKAAIE